MNEAISKIYSWFSVASPVELAAKYPKINFLSSLEEIIRDIGLEQVKTRDFRNTETVNAIAMRYGVTTAPQPQPQSTNQGANPSNADNTSTETNAGTTQPGAAANTIAQNQNTSTNSTISLNQHNKQHKMQDNSPVQKRMLSMTQNM